MVRFFENNFTEELRFLNLSSLYDVNKENNVIFPYVSVTKNVRHKYLSSFAEIEVKVYSLNEDDKHLSKASIINLQKFLPNSVDLEKNYDLLGVAFNAFVVNRSNKNGDCIATKEALEILPHYKNKFFDLEHNRAYIVGFCNGYGFSKFGSDEPLTEEEIKNMTEPFNVVLYGYVWRLANPDFAEKLEASNDPTSPDYMKISASWELGFNDFKLMLGSKNLEDCEIISSENENFEEALKCLRSMGGTGIYKEKNVSRLLIGEDILPLGIGFTKKPAADVEGVLVSKEGEEPIKNDNPNIIKNENILEKDKLLNKNETNSSQSSQSVVNHNIMKIESIKDITDESLKQSEASVAVTDFIVSEIKKITDEYTAKLLEKELEAENIQKEAVAAKEELNSLKVAFENMKAELDTLKTETEKQIKAAKFQERMNTLSQEFGLTDEEIGVFAEDVKDIDDEAFAKYIKKIALLKAKKEIAATTVENPAPSQENLEVIAEAELETPKVPNTPAIQEKNLTEKFKEAFKIKIKI